MDRYRLPNGEEIKVFRSRLSGGWNWNRLKNGRVVAGGVGFPTSGAAYDAAMES